MEYSKLTDFNSKLNALKDLECPGDIIDKIVMDDDFPWGSEEAEVAKDLIASHKNTHPEQLENLFENADNKEQKHRILQNPSCPENLVQKGIKDGLYKLEELENISENHNIASALAQELFIKSVSLQKNIENDDKYIFGQKIMNNLLINPSFVYFLKTHLAQINKHWVIPIAKNVKCPMEILEKIVNDFEIGGDLGKIVQEAILNDNYKPNMEIIEDLISSNDESMVKKGKLIRDTKYPNKIKLLPDVGAPEKLLDIFSLEELINFSDGLNEDGLKEWFKEYRYEDDVAVPQGDEYYDSSIIKKILFPSGLKKVVEIKIDGRTYDEEKLEKIKSMKDFDILIEGELHWSKGSWKTFTYNFSKNTSFDDAKLSAIGKLGVITDYFYDGNLLEKGEDHDLQDGYSSLDLSIYLNGDLHELDLDELQSELEKEGKDLKDIQSIKDFIITFFKKSKIEKNKQKELKMREIEHQTTIGIYCSGDGGADDNEDKKSIINKLRTIKNEYFGDLNKNYNSLGVKVEGQWINDCYDIKDIKRVNEEFDNFIKFIEFFGEDDEDGCCSYNGEKDGFVEAAKNYIESDKIDIEDGDLEFDNTFTILGLSSENKRDNGLGFRLLFSTDCWYSSEEEKLKDLDLYLNADMNDTEGDYFEFSV